ncbi:trypsin-like peptidase domain-containing protein [Nocardia wallacei]|uniref:trypsin-like peptidase domain-containing protein n=1 Tax=Nocardia wallacei TaxID=480035 RepID=UPI00245795EA|nr:serine protease [Nocardia wallacei]
MSSSRPWSKIAAVSALSLLVMGGGAACSSDAGTAPADLHPPNRMEQAAALIRPAIAAIDMRVSGYVLDELGNVFNDGQPYEIEATCTGFVVDPDGYVATAGHCVDIGSGTESFRDKYIQMAALEAHDRRVQVSAEEFYEFGAKNWTVEGEAKGSPLDLRATVQLGDGRTDPLPARVVDYRSLGQGDVALLKVEAHGLAAAELAADADVRIGDQVLAVGYPASTDTVTDRSAEPSNKEGAVSSKKTQGSVPVYEISAAVSPGMSGGPTVGGDGRVIGVNSFLIRGESQPFNFVAPATGLSELLKRNGVQQAPAAVDTSYRDGLAAFYAGRYTTAISDFDKVLALSPKHAKAAEMKTSAAQMRDKFGDWGNSSADYRLWYLIGGAAGAAVVVAILVLLLVRRSRRGKVALAAPPMPSAGPAADPAFRFEHPGHVVGAGVRSGLGTPAPISAEAQTVPAPTGIPVPGPSAPQSVPGSPAPTTLGWQAAAPTVSGWQAAAPTASVPAETQPIRGFDVPETTAVQSIPSEVGADTEQLPSAAPAFCGTCGSRAEPGNRFCRTCGQAL